MRAYCNDVHRRNSLWASAYPIPRSRRHRGLNAFSKQIPVFALKADNCEQSRDGNRLRWRQWDRLARGRASTRKECVWTRFCRFLRALLFYWKAYKLYQHSTCIVSLSRKTGAMVQSFLSRSKLWTMKNYGETSKTCIWAWPWGRGGPERTVPNIVTREVRQAIKKQVRRLQGFSGSCSTHYPTAS